MAQLLPGLDGGERQGRRTATTASGGQQPAVAEPSGPRPGVAHRQCGLEAAFFCDVAGKNGARPYRWREGVLANSIESVPASIDEDLVVCLFQNRVDALLRPSLSNALGPIEDVT